MTSIKNTTESNVPHQIIKKITDTSKTLLSLISFLKTNDDKFKDFQLSESVNLTSHLNNDDEILFHANLIICKKLSITQLPNIKSFRDMIIAKGGKEEKFTLPVVTNLLKSAVFTLGSTTILGFIVYTILNKDKQT